eukprot:scaffold230_cov353-Prasinococcus_capsulatus_cf.AAC.2
MPLASHFCSFQLAVVLAPPGSAAGGAAFLLGPQRPRHHLGDRARRVLGARSMARRAEAGVPAERMEGLQRRRPASAAGGQQAAAAGMLCTAALQACRSLVPAGPGVVGRPGTHEQAAASFG